MKYTGKHAWENYIKSVSKIKNNKQEKVQNALNAGEALYCKLGCINFGLLQCWKL